MNKDKILSPIKQMEQEVKAGDSKHAVFARYIAAGGQAKQGSFSLAMIPESKSIAKYGWMNHLILAMYWIPIGSLYLTSALQGNLSVFLGHFLWPTVVSYFVFKRKAISYYFFLYIIAHEIYVGYNSNIESALFLPLLTVYGATLFGLTILTKLKLFPFQSFFHQKKNSDGSFVFTHEPEPVKPKSKKRSRK